MIKKRDELRDCWTRRGYGPESEQHHICSHAMGYLGVPYLRTEELTSSTIDCSTLVSQSYWEGALIVVPFIAEGQRLAGSAKVIDTIEASEPSDVFVRYESFHHAPDGKYNHVGLYLGEDTKGQPWIIESRGGTGVILTPAEEFPALGGIRRFVRPEQKGFSGKKPDEALRWAHRVPKLGRLGARQYLHNDSERLAHKGLDIYAEAGTDVYSPHSGVVEPYVCPLESGEGISIRSLEVPGLVTRLLHVRRMANGKDMAFKGEKVGTLVRPNPSAIIYVEGLTSDQTHLHIEVEYSTPDLLGVKTFTHIENRWYFNALYLAKIGLLSLPLIGL